MENSYVLQKIQVYFMVATMAIGFYSKSNASEINRSKQPAVYKTHSENACNNPKRIKHNTNYLFKEKQSLSAGNYYIDKAVQSPEIFSGQITTSKTFHFISHGKPGYLFVDNQWLDARQIVKFLQPKLIGINHINIYGCEFAKGIKGQYAVQYLEQTLNVSIAASTNITGKGGDWKLEVGQPRGEIAFLNYDSNLQWTAASTCDTCDFDGDGILNNVDIDDDNDGILDTVECPPSPNLIKNPSYMVQLARLLQLQIGQVLLAHQI